jgi:hypothetical protein
MAVADVDAAEGGGGQIHQRENCEGRPAAQGLRGQGGLPDEGRQGQQNGGQRSLQGKGDGEVVPPAVVAVLAHQEGRMAQAVVLLQGTVNLQMGRGGQGDGEAGDGTNLKPVGSPEGQRGQGQSAQGGGQPVAERDGGQQGQDQQGRDQGDGGDFGSQGQAQEKARTGREGPARASEGPRGQEERRRPPEGHRHVGGDQGAVGDDVGVKGQQEEGQQAAARAPKVGGPAADDGGQQEGHPDDGEPGRQRHARRMGVLPDHRVGDGGEAGNLPPVYLAGIGEVGLQEERRGGQNVGQGRVDVDRLQAQVARAQIRVSHGDVGSLVKGEGGGASMGQCLDK